MVKKTLIIIFLLIFADKVFAKTDCKYFSTADVVNVEFVNKKETWSCKEEKTNFLVTFFTDPKWENTATMTILFIIENL